ncbi:MAG: tryptophan synthase subunit alpha, partial [Hyphomicrobiales bacterium]
YVSITGTTGTATPDADKVKTAVTRIKKNTDLPVVVGFGVRTAEQAAKLAESADAVAVGSALVSQVAEAQIEGTGDAAARIHRVVSTLAEGVANGAV